MKPPKILTYFSDRLDNSAKVLVLVAVTVALTSLAIVLSADFVKERRMNELLGRAEISAEMIPAQPGDELLDQLASSAV